VTTIPRSNTFWHCKLPYYRTHNSRQLFAETYITVSYPAELLLRRRLWTEVEKWVYNFIF